ncbi:MAG: restriction endonuclease subunit S [Xanthobacteraceae bacterium]
MAIEYHRDGLWELPEGWVWARLGDVCKQPVRVDPARQFDDQFQYIDLSAIDEGKIARPQTVSVAHAPSRARQLVQEGDTLLSCVRVYLRNNVIVPSELNGAIASTAFCVLRPSEVIDPSYLYSFVHSYKFTNVLVPLQRGNSPPAVVDGDVHNQLIPIAPLAEQRRIVARIDELFTEIADGETALTRARDDLDAWRRALLKAAVTGELTREWREAKKLSSLGVLNQITADLGKKDVFTPPPDLPKPPTGWTWATLDQLASIDSGQTPKGIETTSSNAGDVPWFKVSSMNESGNESELKFSKWWLNKAQAEKLRLKIFPKGSIVFPKLGGALLTNKRRRMGRAGGIDLNNMAVVPHPMCADYLWLFFLGLDLGSLSDGSVVPQLRKSTVQKILIGLPPEAEMKEIVAQVRAQLPTGSDCDLVAKEQIQSAGRLRQSVLRAAFRGELSEQDPKDESAEGLLDRLNKQDDVSIRPRGAHGPRSADVIRAMS